MPNIYSKRTWLNDNMSDSTGNVCAYDGPVTNYEGVKERETFLRISDCHKSITLHRSRDDTHADFINKMKLLKEELTFFIAHLELTPDNTVE